MNDPIGDMLTRMRNSQMRGKSTVLTPASKLRAWVLDVLHSEGFIRGYKAVESDDGKNNIVIDLKYFDGEPVIKELKRISTPGRRVYTDVKNLPKVRQGLGIAIISTPKGVMTDIDARKQKIGGEIICKVF